jgi:sugar porter (SP) family MFS transporter
VIIRISKKIDITTSKTNTSAFESAIMDDKNMSDIIEKHVDSTDRRVVLSSHVKSKKVFSPMLILALISFQATSVLYGYDDKVIGSVAAMEQFVSLQADHRTTCDDTRYSSILPQVEKYQGKNAEGAYAFSARNQTLVFSVPLVGAIFGAAFSGYLTTKFGRKWPIIGSYAFSYAGTFLQTFAPNFAAFVCGRFLNAFLISIGTTISILYLSEVVPARYRGPAVSASNVFNLISGVIATVICNKTHTFAGQSSFKIPLGAQAILPTFLIPLTAFVPESPLWLLMNDRPEEARASLRKLRAFDDALVDDELRVMKQAHDSEVSLTAGVSFFDLFKRKNIKRTLIAGSMYSVNQVSGIILSTTYATIFLTDLGVGSPFQLTIAASCCVLAGTIIAPFVIENFGRRPVAIVGMSVLFIVDIIAGVLAFFVKEKNVPLAIAVVSFLFNVFWAASFYPLSVVLPTEVPEPRLRSITTSYTLACAYTTAVLTTFSVPHLVTVGPGAAG